MERIIYNFKNNLISLIYTILGVELIFHSVYREFQLTYVITIAIMTILFFAFYNMVEEAKEKGPIKYIPLSILILILSFICINILGSGSNCSFVQWLFQGGSDLENNLGYTLGALLIITFLFSSIFYYFTVIIIRMPVLLLLYFVVMILYIKGPYIQGNIAIYGFLLTFILLFIENTKLKGLLDKSKLNIKIKDSSLLAVAFVGIMLIIALFIPKFNLPKITTLDSLKSYFQNYIAGDSKGFSTESNTSRNIFESTSNNPDKVLYTFKTKENPVYLITHNFDVYEDGKWIKGNKDFSYGDSDNIFEMNKIIDKTKESLDLIDKNEFQNALNQEEVTEFQKILTAEEVDNKCSIIIEPKSSDSDLLIHPSKMNSFYESSQNSKSYLNEFGEFFKTKGNEFIVGEKYNETYYKDIPSIESKEYKIMTFFNEDNYSKFLNMSGNNVDISNIKQTYTQLGNNTSDNIYKLSKSLTDGKVSTYYKAKAIEDYFNTGEYVYNLTLPTNEGSTDYIDYFIFEGKKGYCVQYATAMTILCRASGIPARYVEGFAVDEYKDKVTEGEYQVNASRAHAFVEVYIPGYGWKIFDPTPGIVSDEQVTNETNDKQISNVKKDYTVLIISVGILVSLAVIFIIVMISLKITKRSRNLKRVLKGSEEEALEGIINDTVKILAKVGIVPKKGETSLNFAKRVDSDINIGFTANLESYYNYKYAMKNISKKELKDAIEVNKKTYQYFKENRK